MPKFKFVLLSICCLTAATSLPRVAHASCVFDTYAAPPNGRNIIFQASGALQVPSSTNYPVYIGSAPIVVFPSNAVVMCTTPSGGAETMVATLGIFSQSSGYSGIYRTNIPGIGIGISGGPGSWHIPGSDQVGVQFRTGGPVGSYVSSAVVRGSGSVMFYKIGEIPAGTQTLNGGIIWTQTLGGETVFRGQLQNGATFLPDNPTCAVMGNGTVSLPLPTLRSSDFNNSPNPSAGNSAPIMLTVGNCQNATSAMFTFAGTPDDGNPVYFKNTGTATGVAVRLYTATDGQTIGANGTTNAYPVQITANQASLSVGAQYYKTGASVGAGSVISKATVTMSYN